jgi:hypothetical protein
VVCKSVIRTFYRRLVAAGTPKNLALTACMRKNLTILQVRAESAIHRDTQDAFPEEASTRQGLCAVTQDDRNGLQSQAFSG